MIDFSTDTDNEKKDKDMNTENAKDPKSPQNSDPKKTVNALTELMHSTNGLDEGPARTIINFAIATYGLPQLEKFPILVVFGPAGTGKTTILEVLRQLAFGTSKELIPGDLTYAVLRDTFAATPTALIDEADEINESLLRKRYSKQSSMSITNSSNARSGGWSKVQGDLFGATALHRRSPFRDEAVQSRSIIVRTAKASVVPYVAEEYAKFAPLLAEIAKTVDWEHVPKQGGDRISDTWAPLLEVDAALDGEWRHFANEEIEAAKKNLEYGHQVEPVKACYLALLSNAVEGASTQDRVLISDVVKEVPDELDLNAWQVGLTLRDLKFSTKTKGGKQYVYTGGRENLIAIGRELGIEDEWFDETEAEEGMKP